MIEKQINFNLRAVHRHALSIGIASVEEIFSMREVWNNLVRTMRFPTIFMSWEWISAWINHFGERYEIMILLVRRQKNIVAIIPLARKLIILEDGVMPVRAISLCGTIELYPDHMDVICSKNDNAKEYLRLIFDFLVKSCLNWDVLDLRYLAVDGALHNWYLDLKENWNSKISSALQAPYLDLDGNIEGYLKIHMKRKARYNLNREKKLLLCDRGVTVKRVEHLNEVDQAMKTLFILHNMRARAKGIITNFNGNDIYNFHLDLAKKLQKLGWLRLYIMNKDDNPIAAAYGFVFEKRFSFYQTGLDPKWANFSPGKIMIYIIMSDLEKKNVLEFDFLGGDDNYKTSWTNNYRRMESVRIFAKSGIGKAEWIAEKVRERLKGDIIGRIGFIRHLIKNKKNASLKINLS